MDAAARAGLACPLIDEDFGHFHGWHWGHPAGDAVDLGVACQFPKGSNRCFGVMGRVQGLAPGQPKFELGFSKEPA